MENIKKNIEKPNIAIVAKETTSLADLATTVLRNKILDLSLNPSEHLEEKMLLEIFPFGRTPIREALNRLMAEGLVETKNGRGAYVASMSIWHTLQLLEAYVISERVVASLIKFDDADLIKDLKEIQTEYDDVSKNADILGITEKNDRFHRRLAKATGNRFIIAQHADLHNLARRLSFFVYSSENVSQKEFKLQVSRITIQHYEIIGFIQDKNRSELVALLTEHAVLFRSRLSAVIGGGADKELDFSEVTSG